MVQIAFSDDTIRKDGSVISRQVHRTTMDFDKVLSLMRLRTGLSESDMRSVFQHFADTLELFLPEGNLIQTPIGTFSLGLKQVGTALAGPQGAAPARTVSTDYLDIRLRPDKALVSRLKAKTAVQIVETPAKLVPVVLSAENTDQAGIFNRGTCGDVLHISGSRLSFPKTAAELGVFFVGTATPGETRATSYSRVGSNFIDCKIPPLAPGEYTLEVRTKPTDKDIRVGAMKSKVTIYST